MPTKNTPDQSAIPLTLEDVAHLADATGELPDDTATRLQTLIRCNDLDQVQRVWQTITTHLKTLRQIADDAGVDTLVDGIYVFRIFERLRSEHWETPEDLLHHRADVPYQDLISMAGARAGRAEGTEKTELEALVGRLMVAVGHQLCKEAFVTSLIDRLLEVGEEAAEETLSQFLRLYRRRREVAAES